MRVTASGSTPEQGSTSSVPDLTEYLAQGFPALLRLLAGTDVRELEIREGEARVRVRRAEPVDGEVLSLVSEETDANPTPAAPQVEQITAPLVGTFYLAPDPQTGPLVTEGTRVTEGTVVGIIEALNVLTEVQAPISGTVAAVRATDGEAVEYGQPLVDVIVDA